MSEIKEEMPSMFGKDSKKKEIIKNLDKIYEKIQKTYSISPGDFPNINKMREILEVIVSRNCFFIFLVYLQILIY